jgi:ferredoxin
MDDEGLAVVYKNPIPPEEETASLKAGDNCPVSVITIE